MQIWKTERRFAKRNANLENRAQICKTKCKSGKPNADLQNEMQIWKTERRFAKRNVNLENRAQICKTKCKSGKPNADLQIVAGTFPSESSPLTRVQHGHEIAGGVTGRNDFDTEFAFDVFDGEIVKK